MRIRHPSIPAKSAPLSQRQTAQRQDVYHGHTTEGIAPYIKLTVVDNVLILSFKELRNEKLSCLRGRVPCS
ncbi:type II toxin-antitoxin system MqsR family toxin [Pseudoduganella sp. UC29_106]|uniref:type II toxin-antitoxin system MqsR family toxin n=1 Tax=Pseudoduganella sp. UC29_106 TaxID=3374553 RepID=UPI003757A3B0